MTLTSLLRKPCIVERRVTNGTGVYGDATTTNVATVTVCELQQRIREPGESNLLAKTLLLAWLPAGTVIAAGDALVVDGLTYEVDGDPNRHEGYSTSDHVEVTVSRTVAADDDPGTS